METKKEKLQKELEKLEFECFMISEVMNEVWTYHPSNDDFVNPITYYENLKKELTNIDRKISEIEREINEIL